MTLRGKFVLPLNALLVAVLVASLLFEWRRQHAAGMAQLGTRLDEEVRFVLAARRAFGVSPHLGAFLAGFCHAIDPEASPEHQVALVDPAGGVVAAAATHARRPVDPAPWAARGEGHWIRAAGGESKLIRVGVEDGWRVVLAESTRAVEGRVWANLRRQAGWFLGAGLLVLGAVNLLIRRAVLRPLRHIGRAVRELERGRLGALVTRPNGDELGALARQFNAMSRALAEHAQATRRELEAARLVQSQMLPPPSVMLGCLEVATRSAPRGMVGGDVCDVQPLPGGRVGLLVADLSGHDVAAALHTAMLRGFAWREAELVAAPGELLARLNERLCRNLPEERFATVFFAVYDPGRGVLSWANGGHPPALLRRAGGDLVELEPTGTVLGILPEAAYADHTVEVAPGDRLAIYSDGLTEAREPGGRLWGSGAIARTLSGPETSPAEHAERILREADAFRCGQPAEDDVTLVVAEVRAEFPRSDAAHRP